MNKLIVLFVLIICVCGTISSRAQSEAKKDTSWKKGGVGSLSFNQVSFTNWAAGGDNAISGTAFLTLFANYSKNKLSWDNQLEMVYGMSKIGNTTARKNEDKIDLNSKLGYKSDGSTFYYTFLFNFKSQFANGYSKLSDSIPVSKFAAPAYLLYSLGIDYKTDNGFSFYLSPVTGKTLIVNDPRIADAGIYGNEALKTDANGITSPGKKIFNQLGPYLRSTYNHDIFTNVNLITKLELFSNYLKNPQNIAVNWEVMCTMKVNKFLSAFISTHLIYDDLISVPIIKELHGVKVESLGKKIQFKQALGLGLSYKF